MGDEDGAEEVRGAVGAEHDAGTRLRTFLIADVRGYTRFTQERGDEEAAKLAIRFAELARCGITDHGGELVELRGDEALGVFASAREALRAAVELQRLFRTSTDGEPGLRLGVGIGIDAGEAVRVEGGYRGGALNLAARLCSRAAAGEILASETVISLARHVEGIRLEHRGTERLKGLEDPVKVIEVMPESPLPRLPAAHFAVLRRFRRRHLTRRNAAVGALIAVTAAAGSAVVFAVNSGSGGVTSAAAATRVGLVLPRGPTATDDVLAAYPDGLLRAERLFGIDTETLNVDGSDPQLSRNVRSRLDDFDLLLVAGTSAHALLAKEVPQHPDTRFVFLDPHLDVTKLQKLPNYTDIFFNEGPAAYLAGTLSALMAKARTNGKGTPVVSIVAGDKTISANQVFGFWAGAKDNVPGTTILLDYSHDFSDPKVCEEIANRQIDKGARVVFAAAGTCSLGALSAAAVRGVWGVGSDVDRSYLGPHVLASAVKRRDQAVDYVVRSFLDGTLPQGVLDVGIERNLVDIVGINPQVPPAFRKTLARVKKERMKTWAGYATPLAQS